MRKEISQMDILFFDLNLIRITKKYQEWIETIQKSGTVWLHIL